MRLGVCCRLNEATEAIQAGFDYVELSASEMAKAPDLSAYHGLPVEVTNLFFPGHIRLYGEDRAEALAVGKQTIAVAASVGVRVMVIGSGGARRAPEGVDPEQALAEFVDLIAELSPFAQYIGVTLAPESLNRTETNVGNSLRELSQKLMARGVGYTCDSFHVLREAEAEKIDVDWTAELKAGAPVHIHLANLQRLVPEPGDQSIASLFVHLRSVGYKARVSFEGNRGDLTLQDLRVKLSLLV